MQACVCILVGTMHCVFPLHKGARICHKLAFGIWIHISRDGSLLYRCLQSLLQNMSKAALIFVVYFDNHCQAQELKNDLPGCYGVETHIL